MTDNRLSDFLKKLALHKKAQSENLEGLSRMGELSFATGILQAAAIASEFESSGNLPNIEDL